MRTRGGDRCARWCVLVALRMRGSLAGGSGVRLPVATRALCTPAKRIDYCFLMLAPYWLLKGCECCLSRPYRFPLIFLFLLTPFLCVPNDTSFHLLSCPPRSASLTCSSSLTMMTCWRGEEHIHAFTPSRIDGWMLSEHCSLSMADECKSCIGQWSHWLRAFVWAHAMHGWLHPCRSVVPYICRAFLVATLSHRVHLCRAMTLTALRCLAAQARRASSWCTACHRRLNAPLFTTSWCWRCK